MDGRDGQSGRLDDFCRGLFPILLEGDAAAFRRYLARWEDVIGDTAELAETSEAQQRRTMTAMLRNPRQFRLPPWPRTPAEASPLASPPVATPPVTTPPPAVATPEPIPHAPTADVAAAPSSYREDRVEATYSHVTGAGESPQERDGQSAVEPEPSPQSYAAYQVDMLTGELVPRGTVMGVADHRHMVAEATITQLEESEPKRPPRRRRRRAAVSLTQLALPDDYLPLSG